jgi:hypothetical protein
MNIHFPTLINYSPCLLFFLAVFFKFQSITTTKIHIALQAFPETPWAFVFRQSVQTMMSHLDPKKGGEGPCMRSKKGHPPSEVTAAIQEFEAPSGAPDEAWCAAHLRMLCSHAVEAYRTYGRRGSQQRGVLVHYESLPAGVPVLLLKLFGVTPSSHWLLRIAEESAYYSKARKATTIFQSDSKDKDSRASSKLKLWASRVLEPLYVQMSLLAVEAAQVAATDPYRTPST